MPRADITQTRDWTEPYLARQGKSMEFEFRARLNYQFRQHGSCPARRARGAARGARSREGIVAYCRGVYYVHSFEAVAALRDYRFNVCRLEEGLPG